MNISMGKVVVVFILLASVAAGAGLYYLQVYGYYQEIAEAEVRLVVNASGQSETITTSAIEAIDADSSPIRYRACFATDLSLEAAAATYAPVEKAVPRNAPGWFSCFDADAIGAALKAGTAQAFLSEKNIHFGVDRVVALTVDGRGYVWHELNECGAKAYDGTIVGEECPKRD